MSDRKLTEKDLNRVYGGTDPFNNMAQNEIIGYTNLKNNTEYYLICSDPAYEGAATYKGFGSFPDNTLGLRFLYSLNGGLATGHLLKPANCRFFELK